MTRSQQSIARVAIVCTCLAATFIAGACAQSTSRDDSLEALTIAVKNNPDLELMATDAEAKILTVRVKSVDRVITVTPDDLDDGRLVLDLPEEGDAPSARDEAPAEAPRSGQPGTASSAPMPESGPPSESPEEPASDGARLTAGAEGKRAELKATADGGTQLTAQSKGKRADVKTGADGITVDAGGRRVTVGGDAGGLSVAAEGESEDTDRDAAPPDEPPSSPPAAASSSAGRRRVTSPITCGATQELQLDNIVLEATGNAIEASGSCRLILTNSEISGGEYGVEVRGDAEVQLLDSVVDGRRGALRVAGMAVASAQDSELRGGVKTSGKGRFDDQGGNTIR